MYVEFGSAVTTPVCEVALTLIVKRDGKTSVCSPKTDHKSMQLGAYPLPHLDWGLVPSLHATL